MPTVSAPPRDAFLLSEAISVKAGTLNEDGTVNLHIIRPGIGRGKGKHLYTPEMLAENAEVFNGWRMYVDHLSDEARRRLGGLPRSIRDLGGRIVEATWDPTVPADPKNGWGPGAVVGRARPVPLVRELIEHDPELIEASISARATNVKPMQHNGQQVWMVEGIEPNGSVDWVTEAGAGGRVVSLMEAHFNEEGIALLESLSDDELVEHLRSERPDLVRGLQEAKGTKGKGDGDAEDAADGGDDELEELTQKHMKRGLPRALAEKAARKELAASAQEGADTKGDDVPVTTDSLREAFETEEGKALLDELLNDRVAAAVEQVLPEKVEEALDEERELIRIEANADAQRQILLRDMRDHAVKTIKESKLPTEFQSVLLGKYNIVDGKPTPALDVIEETGDDGEITKTAIQVLEESLKTDLDEQRTLLAAASPTKISGPNRRLKEARENETDEERRERELAESNTTGSALTDKLLVSAGHDKDVLGKVYG